VPRKIVLARLLATLPLGAAASVAQERGFYYGVDVGGSTIESDGVEYRAFDEIHDDDLNVDLDSDLRALESARHIEGSRT
jgi:hypothetical protein